MKDESSNNKYYGTQSQNENYLVLDEAQPHVYTVQAKFERSYAGGYPPYSFSVLTEPLRLGSRYDRDSAAKVAANELIDVMSSQDRMGLVSFNTGSTLDSRLRNVTGTDKTTLKTTINGL